MTTADSASVRTALETAFPHPAEEYADAYFCQEMTAVLASLAEEYRVRFLETVDEIRAGGLVSEEFVLRREEKRNKTVNVPLLREELPDLFAELAFVPVGDASKLLSKKFIYDATKRLIKDRITKYEEVNVKELEARLPEPEYSRYVSDKLVSERYVIEVKP
ncbi:MAG: hypothetical protein PHR14_10750 [Oscillospiraceae bacterium]|nr:hypothetical protein [Oscillospiraceae bacterium]